MSKTTKRIEDRDGQAEAPSPFRMDRIMGAVKDGKRDGASGARAPVRDSDMLVEKLNDPGDLIEPARIPEYYRGEKVPTLHDIEAAAGFHAKMEMAQQRRDAILAASGRSAARRPVPPYLAEARYDENVVPLLFNQLQAGSVAQREEPEAEARTETVQETPKRSGLDCEAVISKPSITTPSALISIAVLAAPPSIRGLPVPSSLPSSVTGRSITSCSR